MVMNLFDDGVADEIALQKRRREGELSSSENNNVVASTDTQERFAGGVDMSIDVPDELERMRKTITGLIHEPDWWNLDRVIEVADEFINTTRHTKSVRYLVAILIQGIAPPPFGARRFRAVEIRHLHRLLPVRVPHRLETFSLSVAVRRLERLLPVRVPPRVGTFKRSPVAVRRLLLLLPVLVPQRPQSLATVEEDSGAVRLSTLIPIDVGTFPALLSVPVKKLPESLSTIVTLAVWTDATSRLDMRRIVYTRYRKFFT